MLAFIVIDIILVGVLGVAIWQKVANKTDDKKDASVTDLFSDPDTSDLDSAPSLSRVAIKSRNVERKNDVSRLLTAVTEYMANNNGSLPTMIFENQLRMASLDDTPTTVPDMSRYSSISISDNEHAGVDNDQLILALQATCGPDKGAVPGTSRSVAVLYGMENPDGTFSPACQEF